MARRPWGFLIFLALFVAPTLVGLAACAGATGFTVPPRAYLDDYRQDFGPGPAERDEGGVTAFYVYPTAVTAARCRSVGDAARCRFAYTYDGRNWSPMEGTFARGPGRGWRYVADSAERVP